MTTKGPFKFIYSPYLDFYKSETKQMFSFTEVSPEDLRLGSRVQQLVRSRRRRRRIPGGQCGAWRGGGGAGRGGHGGGTVTVISVILPVTQCWAGRSPHPVRHVADWPAGPAPSCTSQGRFMTAAFSNKQGLCSHLSDTGKWYELTNWTKVPVIYIFRSGLHDWSKC